MREAGAESAAAAERKESPSLKTQMLESDLEKAKRLSIENDNEFKIILDKRKEVTDETELLSLIGIEGTIANALHEDSLSCLRYAAKHHATFTSQNLCTLSDAVDASKEELIQNMDSKTASDILPSNC